jgi:hypothetical protein
LWDIIKEKEKPKKEREEEECIETIYPASCSWAHLCASITGGKVRFPAATVWKFF